jgi:hypothetical protein
MPGWPGGLGERLQGGPPPQAGGLGDRLQNWWNNTTFFKPAWDDLVGGLTAPGDVMSGAQPTMAADPQTGEFHTAPELMDRAGALAGTLTLGAGAVPAEANSLRMGIKAYHGSPHDFERFDASKIGTGEGAQAYGHGIYLAEREGVAKEYRDALKFKGGAGNSEAAIAASELLDSWRGDFAGALDDAKYYSNAKEVIAELKKLEANPPTGRMYEVDIAAEPEQFLDWDKPLREQSPKVQEALTKLKVEGERPIQFGEMRETFLKPMAETIKGTEFERFVKPDDFYSGNVDMNEVRRSLAGSPEKLARIEELQAAFTKHTALRGSDIYNTLAKSYEDRIGGGLTAAKDSPAVADQLQDVGIPGIRYLDQGSRGLHQYDVGSPRADFGPYTPFRNRADAEAHLAVLKRGGFDDAEIKEIANKQTSNYVVFDERLISILKKYGLPISAAGLAALSQLYPEEAQATQAGAPGLGERLQAP